ncbi:MAG: hypothetical protein AAGG01_02260 [Planctomycetota bacterium]
MSLKSRLAAVSERLRASLTPLLMESLGGRDLRPSVITETLGLDKSLASRISRALRASDPMEFLHEIPTPQGLTILLDACAGASASEDGLNEGRASVEALRSLLVEFPGGRNDLDAALAAWIPSLRTTALRKGRREIFRGWSTVMGIRSACRYVGYFVMPSETPGRLDTFWVSSRQGLRRLREDEPVEIAGIVTNDPATFAQRRSLDGRSFLEEPHSMLCEAFTSMESGAFTVVEETDRRVLSIAGNAPEVNHPVHVTIGGCTQSHFDDHVSEDESYLWVDTVAMEPTETLIVDFLVHEDVKSAGPPLITRIIEGSRSYGSSAVPSDLGPAALEHGLELVSMETTSSLADAVEVAHWRDLLDYACGVRGHSLEAFQLHRFREEFPLPMHRTAIWLPLPE